jgi:hypothetical protein
MASGHVNRIQRPNTWLHRPILQNVRKLLPIRSRPHMAPNGPPAMSDLSPLLGKERKWCFGAVRSPFDPFQTWSLLQRSSCRPNSECMMFWQRTVYYSAFQPVGLTVIFRLYQFFFEG